MNRCQTKAKTMWFRLDNSAAIYPMVRTLSAQSLFRLGAELYEDIDREALLIALDKAYERFPYYKVELQMGAFRPYFITNHRNAVVKEDDGCLLKRIDFYRNAGYLIRVTYYRKKIMVDYFHGLCDGVGAMEFLKTLLYYYIIQKGGDVNTDNKVSTLESAYNVDEIEDSFRKYYKAADFKKGFKIMASGLALPIKGNRFIKEGLGLIQGSLITSELLFLAKKYDCSLTVFLSALSILSVASTQIENPLSNKNYVAFIPVNLRNFYPSKTRFNFTTVIKCSVNPRVVPPTLEAYIKEIKTQLKDRLNQEELDTRVSFTCLMDKNPLLRFTPLFIKAFMAKVGRSFTGGSKQTFILSNLGRAAVPESFKDYIKELFFNQNCNNKTPNNIGIVSFFDRTVVSFSRAIKETKIEEFFFCQLAKMGLKVEVTSNFREVKHNAL